ncbi:unnamed protein product [Nezara viridula]|uniref:Uncharacterized protein n=1 Tax=Nezara viridula TaxID=85310 RepID=A0A9P0H5H3_NEZVI|nr:unnamed protein product [Nezara viridula]
MWLKCSRPISAGFSTSDAVGRVAQGSPGVPSPDYDIAVLGSNQEDIEKLATTLIREQIGQQVGPSGEGGEQEPRGRGERLPDEGHRCPKRGPTEIRTLQALSPPLQAAPHRG